MSAFQFTLQTDYLDDYAAMHSIMIRGINQNMGVEEANNLIRQVFQERFGEQKVV